MPAHSAILTLKRLAFIITFFIVMGSVSISHAAEIAAPGKHDKSRQTAMEGVSEKSVEIAALRRRQSIIKPSTNAEDGLIRFLRSAEPRFIGTLPTVDQ